MNVKKYRSLLAMAIVILLAALLAYAGSWSGSVAVGIPVFALCVTLAFTLQWLAFIPAYKFQTEHFYDLTGSLTYLLVVVCALLLSGAQDSRSILLAALISVWAIRLGSFLFIRISKDGSDTRFDAIKPNFLRFLVAWSIQGLWVSVTCASALAAITSNSSAPLGWLGLVGLLVWLSGFAIEVIADHQKRVFRAEQAGKKGFIKTGLWAYSRHPNYFGEIVLWIGISLIALPALASWQCVTLISPIFVTLLITRISGVPMLEASADKRWQGNPDYEHYKANTPVLVPRLTKPQAHQPIQP